MDMEPEADYKGSPSPENVVRPSERFVEFVNKVIAEERRKKNLACGTDPLDLIESRLWHAADFDACKPYTHVQPYTNTYFSLRDGFGLPKNCAKEYTRLIKKAVKAVASSEPFHGIS